VPNAQATKLEKLLKEKGLQSSINPEKPRKGCFEVRDVEGGKTYVSLLVSVDKSLRLFVIVCNVHNVSCTDRLFVMPIMCRTDQFFAMPMMCRTNRLSAVDVQLIRLKDVDFIW
jgi:hypothetical protein